MNMKLTIITFFLALITLTSTAQTKSEENPGWLWEISGNGITEKSYLFGTCHGDGHIFKKEDLENDTCKFGNYIRSMDAVPGAESADDNNHEILHDRNLLWIPVIKENIVARPCMIAVGYRHLMGRESLIPLLRRDGYTVTPIRKN